MSNDDTKLTATQARAFAARIRSECSECFGDKVKAVKFFGRWEININGGRGACYGRTVSTVEDAEDVIRIFQN